MKTKIILTALTAMMITHDGLNAQTAKAPKKMLVAYFSHSGNTRTVRRVRNIMYSVLTKETGELK